MRSGRTGIAFAAAALALAAAVAPTGGAAEPDDVAGRTLTLQECVEIGLRRNPATEIARQGLEAAAQRVTEAKAGWYPSFKLSAGYTYTTPAGTAMAPPEDSFDNRFSVKQTLYDGGQTASAVEGARHGIDSQQSEQRRTDLDVLVNVQTAYYEVLRRRDFIGIARATLQSSERHVEQARALHQEGVAPRSDVIKAEVQASNAQLELIRAENAVLVAKAGLAAAMGLPAATDFAVADPQPDDGSPAPSLQDALAAAPERRPELAAIRARLKSADAGVRQAESGLRPGVSLDASYGWQEEDFVPLDPKWSVGVSVTLPVFERRVARAKVDRAVAERGALKATETQAARAVELEVQQAWLSLKEALERRTVTTKILEQAEEDIRVSEGRYQEGLGNILEVIDARTVLTQAGVNAVIARYDSAQARARLDRALGVGLPEEKP